MTARLASALPKDADSNGLTSIEQQLIDNPDSTHVVVGIIDTRKVIIDAERDETIPYARFRHIEVIADSAQAAQARSLLIAALTKRTGAQTLPFETGETSGPRPWTAADFEGKCAGCGDTISPGEAIQSDGEGGWVCTDCGYGDGDE